jgi:hypothetical protein
MAAKLLTLLALFLSSNAFAARFNCGPDHLSRCLECSLPAAAAVTAVTDKSAAKLLQKITAAFSKKFPGLRAELGAPQLLEKYDRMGFGAVYATRFMQRGQTFTVKTNDHNGLYQIVGLSDPGFLRRCVVSPVDETIQTYDVIDFEMLDARGKSVAFVQFGPPPSHEPPQPLPANNGRGCLIQCPTDENGQQLYCDPSFLCNPGL